MPVAVSWAGSSTGNSRWGQGEERLRPKPPHFRQPYTRLNNDQAGPIIVEPNKDKTAKRAPSWKPRPDDHSFSRVTTKANTKNDRNPLTTKSDKDVEIFYADYVE